MNCPKCGIILNLCAECIQVDNAITGNKNAELFICKGCKFTRPKVWWDALQLDVNTEIDWTGKEDIVEEAPDELTEYCESPWGD